MMAATRSGLVLAGISGGLSQPMLGFTTTFCPFLTKASMPPRAAMPASNISTAPPLRTAIRSKGPFESSSGAANNGLSQAIPTVAAVVAWMNWRRLNEGMVFCFGGSFLYPIGARLASASATGTSKYAQRPGAIAPIFPDGTTGLAALILPAPESLPLAP